MALDDQVIQKMKELALAACGMAYCPYSNFPVGAAVLTENGEIFTGCNVENASYSLTICAERNAIFQAVARGHHVITAIAIATPTKSPTSPCGACRQVISEFGPNAQVIVFANGREVLHQRASDLLPDAFGPKSLQ